MRDITVDYLNILIESLGIFSERKGICVIEEIRSGDSVITAPVYYNGGGDSEPIDLDFNSAILYHRVNGNISRTQEDSDTGCGTNIIETSPMRLVCYFPKSVYQTDNANIEGKVAHNISNLIGQSNIKSLATTLQVDYVNVNVDSIILNKRDVFNSEFSGVEYTVPSNYCLIAIDYDIEIGGDESCFLNYGCDDTPINLQTLIDENICSKVTILNSQGDIIAYVTPGDSYTCEGTQVRNYISTASTTQTFAEFVGISNITVIAQGIGVMGHLAGLNAAHKLVTNWDSATGIATFKTTLPAGVQLTVIESDN